MQARPHTPLASAIATTLRREWREHVKPGTRLPAEAALARRFGVSNITIREALALLQAEGRIERRHGSGTYLADPLRTRPVGIFSNMDLMHPRVGPYWRALAYEMRLRFATRNVLCHLYLGHNSPGSTSEAIECPELFQALEQHRLGGLVVLTCPSVPEQTRRVFGALDIPVVGRGSGFCCSYSLPLDRMIAAGLHDLVGRGCRRIAFVGWMAPRHPQEFPLRDVLRTERAYLVAHDVQVRAEWIRGDLPPNLPGAGWEEFREIWAATPEKPDGLMICDDCLLPDVGLALQQLGVRVPGDLAVVAITNRGVSPPFPFPLTRIESDPADAAAEITDMLVRLMVGERPGDAQRLGTFAVITPTDDQNTEMPLTPARRAGRK